MAESLSELLAQLRRQLLDADSLVRAVASGRRRHAHPRWRRAELRYVDLRSGRHLQVTTYDDTQAFTRNTPVGEPSAGTVDDLLAEPFATWHLESREAVTTLRLTKRGRPLLHTAPRQHNLLAADTHAHDRPKPRLLPPDDPYLRAVGISDDRGRVKPSMQAKHRQIEEFLRLLSVALDDALGSGRLPTPRSERPLRVVDLGCGNAYLTFAAYRYLAGVRGLPVRMTGVDLKGQARDRNTALAAEVGAAADLEFVQAPIATAQVAGPVDVVLVLHACDTATDDALARAVAWRAPLVLAAPCCHHYVQEQLRTAPTPPPFGLLTRHGILRERLGDTLTDAMRAALLRRHGYRVEVVEFVASRHTPRNTMLRALRTGATGDPGVRGDYEQLATMWHAQPKLAELLEDPA